MRTRLLWGCLAACLPFQASFAQDIGIGADQGYQMAYEAFCRGTHVQVQNVLQLLRLKQISDPAFIEARFKSLRDCPKLLMGGLPEGTIQAVQRMQDVKRIFHVPSAIQLADPRTNRQVGSVSLQDFAYTLLTWQVQRYPKDIKRIREVIASGADVNWRNELGFPVVYFAVHRRSPEILKTLVDAGARVDIDVPMMFWNEQTDQMVYPQFLTTQSHPTPYGSLAINTGRMKAEVRGDAIWKSMITNGQIQPFLYYVASTCTGFRSPDCWDMLNILFDKGVRPPPNFLHFFLRDGSFFIHVEYPEAAAGLDRLLKLGASLNAPNSDGETVLARLMKIRHRPETFQALVARGASLQVAAAGTGATAALPSAAVVPLGKRTVTADLNVRGTPSTSGQLIVVLKPGQLLTVDGRNPDATWSRVAVPGAPSGGWVLNTVLLKNSH